MMHIDTATTIRNGKRYTRHLLRETFRENGKVRHRTLFNLKGCSEDEIIAMKLALQHKKNLSVLTTALMGVEVQQGLSVGALLLLQHIAKSIGLTKALGNDRQGKLALFQIFARVIDQGSRLSAVRLCKRHDVERVLGLSDFSEEDLYKNLDWLTDHQAQIENSLYQEEVRGGSDKNTLFLYDVSSSYFEGEQNELAEFGYNRDKKSGKRQIVLGLLCNQIGHPVSVQVFAGNTNDTKTLKAQADKVADRFGGGSVTLVGDGGMIKGPQIKELKEMGFHYITSIGKTQINSLIVKGVFQLSLFDNELCEIVREEEGLRYILRRNPQRMEEIRKTRAAKLAKLKVWLADKNLYLKEHAKAKPVTILTKLTDKIQRFKLSSFVEARMEDREVTWVINEEKQKQHEELDGCYVIKTDLTVEAASKEVVHARYKALIDVENAFRTFKTGHLELRPIYVRKESRTRGHALVVMLAYRLTQELQKHWQGIDFTVEEGLSAVAQYCTTELIVGGESQGCTVQKPNQEVAALFSAAGFELPKAWVAIKQTKTKGVSTKTTLPPHRKKR